MTHANQIHVAVGFYPNGDYIINYVRDEDLAGNIEYNRVYRPGRAYFVDGKHICGGPCSPDKKAEFLFQCRQRLVKLNLKPALTDSRPYR